MTESRQSAGVPAICGYPLPGWRLQRVEYDDGAKLQSAPGWIVSLHTEPMNDEPVRQFRQYRCVMARSLIGPLEAWDEAIAIALRENERAAVLADAPREARRREAVPQDCQARAEGIAKELP